MTDAFEFDHTSVAVKDIRATARWLRRELGATPMVGEVLEDFRFAMFHLGGPDGGGRLELIQAESVGGFLQRFVAKHGESLHHLTFDVPSLPDAVEEVRQLGLTVVGEDYSHAPWQEAFIMPEAVHAVVIQLSATSRSYPPPSELVSTTARDVGTYPSSRRSRELRWWEFVWEETPLRRSTLVSTTIHSRDTELSSALFGGVLRGVATPEGDGTRYSWSHSSLIVRPALRGGVVSAQFRGPLPSAKRIGLLPIEEACFP